MCCNNSWDFSKLPVVEHLIFLLDYKDELMESKSLRLNLFPDIKKHIPDNTDLSLWKVKDMKWIKDCPVPADEEFKRVAELWEVE